MWGIKDRFGSPHGVAPSPVDVLFEGIKTSRSDADTPYNLSMRVKAARSSYNRRSTLQTLTCLRRMTRY